MDKSRKFDTFIFDLDGTLLDTVPDLTLLANFVLREIGFPEHTQDEILSYVGSGVRRLIVLAMPPDTPEDIVERALEIWGQNFSRFYQHSAPYPNVEKLLDGLHQRGCGVGVVSNKQQPGVDDILSRWLPGKIDVMFGESKLIPRKPDPKGIQVAMNFLKTSPSETIYIGDSPSDIVAGKNAGCATAAALWGYHKEEDFFEADALADYFLHDPIELLPLAK